MAGSDEGSVLGQETSILQILLEALINLLINHNPVPAERYCRALSEGTLAKCREPPAWGNGDAQIGP